MTNSELRRLIRARRKQAGQCLRCPSKSWYRSVYCRPCLAKQAVYHRNSRRRLKGLPPLKVSDLIRPRCTQPPTLETIRAWLASRREKGVQP